MKPLYRTTQQLVASLGAILAVGFLLPSSASAGLVDCATFDTGGNACEVCATDNYYLGEDFWLWDWFNNTIPGRPEVVFSQGASNALVDTMGNLSLNQNGETTDPKPFSAYMPAGYVSPQGLPRIIAFNLQGLKFTNHPASRTQLAARVVYDLHYSVPSVDGADSSLEFNWGYTEGIETTGSNGRPFLNSSSKIDGFLSTKSFFMSTPPRRRHVECHNLYVQWCGDGVVDAWEQCDTGTQNGTPGSPCSTTCTPVTTQPVCTPGISGAQTAPLTSSTAGLCAAGTVETFTAIPWPSGTYTYSWGCSGSQVGGSCVASFNPAGQVCVPGPTTGAQASQLNSGTPWLCTSGAAENFTPTFDINTLTISYAWGCNGSQVGGPCSASHTVTVDGVCVNGGVSGPQTKAITDKTPWLCAVGPAETFSESRDEAGTIHYTWGCVRSAVGGACSASYNSDTPPPGVCVNGGVSGTLTAAITSGSPWLCAVGTAENFSTSGPDADGVHTYVWGCQGSAVGGACSANFDENGNGNACVPGGISSNVGGAISSATPGLCAAGPGAVQDFQQTAPDNSGNVFYTWACAGSIAGGLCSTHYVTTSGGGSSCAPWYTVGTVTSPITQNTPGLCAGGTAAVHDFTATAPDASGIIHYSWACGSSMAGGSCIANGGGGSGGPPGGPYGGGGYCGDGYLVTGESCEPNMWSVVGGITRLVPNTRTPNCRSNCTYCGDGVLQIDQGEECDSALPGCTASCQLGTFTNPGQYPGDLNITNPGGGVSKLADFRVIVGNDVPVFSDENDIIFKRSFTFYIDPASEKQVCLRDHDAAIKGDNADYCKPLGMSAPDDKLVLFRGSETGVKQFIGNTASISGGYEDTDAGSFYVELGYLQEPIKVRVAKPAVANTAGGGGYLARSAGYDVGYLNFDPAGASAQRFIASIQAGNFTTTSLRSSDLGAEKNLSSLSYAATAASTTNDRIGANATDNNASLDRAARPANLANIPSGTTVSSEADFDILPKFRDQENVRAQKYGDLVLGSMRLTGVRTIIVEDGDLRITGDITHSPSASYAFVVKHGNVIIDASVKSISGIFIVSDGMLLGTAQTTDQLAIDGSVYGDIEPLLDTRTYIRGEANYDALSVGVIINYSNRILTNPPPLVKDFISSFSLDRVAK